MCCTSSLTRSVFDCLTYLQANIGIGRVADDDKRERLNTSTKTAKDISSAAADAAKSTGDAENSKAFSALSLSTLPSSLTALMLSVLDSPAYANLTSTYLNETFNPATPDDPNVRYFSVAGRMSSNVNIWHPFWLPKLIVDGVEKKHWDPNLSPEDWGNDGLVPVASAKWGEFLGVMEGCDHWEMRGARGIEFGVDLPAFPAIGLGGPTSTKDRSTNEAAWGWLASAWRKEETRRRDAEGSKAPASRASSTESSISPEREQEDDVITSSKEKLSAVLDWIAEQVPSTPLLGSKAKDEGQSAKKQELQSKEDLERFYVALTRKLYDEGL